MSRKTGSHFCETCPSITQPLCEYFYKHNYSIAFQGELGGAVGWGVGGRLMAGAEEGALGMKFTVKKIIDVGVIWGGGFEVRHTKR